MDGRRPGDPIVTDLGNAVYAIDTRMSGYEGITASYLIAGAAPCLVETGTAASADTVTAALRHLGVGPADLASIVVSHVHLDHAGGAGDLADRFPGATVYAHEEGARHLVDPDRLLASARRVFGSVLDDVFGLLRPVDRQRVQGLADRTSIDLGDGRRLAVSHAPGHARHHLGLVDEATGDLYVGDAAGISVPETGDLRPATPPPDFDLDAAVDSLQQFRRTRPTRLLFSHFGPVEAVDDTLQRAVDELRVWVDWVRTARAESPHVEHVLEMVRDRQAERYAAFAADPAVTEKFEHLNAVASNVDGIARWLDRPATTTAHAGPAD